MNIYNNPDYADGPVVVRTDEGLQVSYFEQVQGTWSKRMENHMGNTIEVHNPVAPPFSVMIRDEYHQNLQYSYPEAKSVIVISDIEGNYVAFRNLLLAHKVIDMKGNWIFGEGHLVMLGDLFDRGPDTAPILWHLYKLEDESTLAGGKVHVLLGNHEVMIFEGDLRYIHRKHRDQMLATGMTYDQCYANNTVLGNWLRNKPAAISIGSTLFSHAGISPGLAGLRMPLDSINASVNRVLNNQELIPQDTSRIETIFGSDGPFWYRDWVLNTPSEETLDSILTFYEMSRMVIGHTLVPEVTSFHSGKIFAIDTKHYHPSAKGLKALAIYNQHFYEIDEAGQRHLIEP